ncbi:MAG TPA: DUF6188 family protein, partial [Pirellulales bacterium]|nr:DUF6188 family protein [Pirellulales bacterium]
VFEVNQRLAGTLCTSVALRERTLDLEIRFDTGHLLQAIPNSAGYEAWAVYEPARQFIAVGGGELTIFGPKN